MCATAKFHALNALGLTSGLSSAECFAIKLGERQIDLWLRNKSGDLFVFYEVFLDRCYFLPKDLCGEVTSVVDLGAHVGMASLFYLQQFPNARFVCVEANPLNVPLLRRNLLAFRDQVCILEAAATSGPGVVFFDAAKRSWEGRMARDASHGRATLAYGMHEILELCKFRTVDVLKIDVEGAEREILGIRNDWLRNVKLIVIELHGDYSLENFKRDVEPFGFEVLGPDLQRGNPMVLAVAKNSSLGPRG